MTNLKSQQGQTLLEVIAAIGIISTGLLAVWGLFFSNFAGEQESRARLVGANLAREGLEAVKNIRDSNWLKSGSNLATCGASGNLPCLWDDGLADTSGDTDGVIDKLLSADGDLRLDYGPDSISDAGARIFIDSVSGFYTNTASGNQASGYRRFVVLRNICCADTTPADFKCDNLNQAFVVKNPGQLCSAGQIKIGLDVTVTVSWQVSGKNRQTVAEDQLFNWR